MEKVIRIAIACGLSFALSLAWTSLFPPLVAITLSAASGIGIGRFAVSIHAPNVLPVYRVEVRPDDYEREQFSDLFGGHIPPRWDAPEVQHLRGVPWHEAEMPPASHECWPQTDGWIGFDQIQRCACGAIRATRFGGGWLEQNARRRERSRADA